MKIKKLKYKPMNELENKSYRGMLVEVVIQSYIKENLFETVEDLKETLQERLNSNLKFETRVSEIEIKNGHTFGKISFDDGNGEIRIIDFTVILNN
jgi:hypothetical protein